MTESPRAVRVFVSYSHETRSQDLKVQALAVELEEAGFSVFCDQTVDPPDSWSKLIEREFRRADVLLCVCTATYSRRVDSGVPGGQGRGVTQEGSMIHNEVYDLKMRTDRFRVLHLEGTTVVVPTTLGGKGTHVLRWPSKRDELYVALRRPTNRRRIVGAFERAFGEDVKALDTWAGAFVALSVDEILDFDDQARRIAYEILRLDEPTRQRDALASLADLVGDEHRGPLEDVAEDLNLGRLRRSAPPEEDTDSEPPSSQIVPKRELDRYLEMIDARYSELRLAGFGMKVRVPIRLDDLYVPLHARIDWTTKRRQVFRSGEDAQGHDGEIALAKAFAVARKRGMRGVVLLGDPGSGKTTHLQQVLLKVVREGAESIGLPAGTVPVFLPLRKLRDLEAGLPDFIQQELHDPLLQTAADFGKRLCGRRRLLFLFDGLDEVANAEDRRRVAKWIEDARRADPTNYYLVSCRFSGYTLDAQLDEGFLELQLRPLSPEQVETFVRNWYRIVEGATNEEEQQARVKAEAGADDLLGTLAQPEMSSRRVLEMTRNPLLLTTICLVHRDSGRLPRQRVLLYEEAVSVLLERWRTETKDGLGVTFPAQEAQHVLQPVAWWMHQEQGRIRATAAQLEEPVSEGLQAIGRPNTTPGAFLETIRDESGLLTGWGVDEFGFMHLGFQEYMVAQAIRGRVFEEPERLRWLASRFGDGWWQEVILLLLAKGNPPMFKRFMSEVVARPDFVKWTATKMMGLCLAEAFGVSAAPFVELLRAQEDPDGTLEARQVVGFELLAQRMPSVVDGMEDLLREHPAELVRHRWRVWKRTTKGMEVVMAPRGGVELVRIPGGRFLMGSPEEEEAEMEDGNRYEGPQHEVALGDFYIARTPLTNVQYRKFLEDPERPKGVKEPEHWGDRNYNQDEQPVVGVSWDDAKAYCAWAGLVLPTEAQWEYACRAGTTTRHYSGDTEEDLAKVGWYQGNSGGQLHAVGELEPNEFGLYDMHGNVLEWCEDDWVDSYANAEHRAGDGLRVKPVGGADRVVRGGLFGGAARDARSAFRDRGAPVSRWYYVGFRPAQGHPFQA